MRSDLVAAGEVVWWDDDILPGSDWKREIRKAMKNSYAVVLCLSKEAEAHNAGIWGGEFVMPWEWRTAN